MLSMFPNHVNEYKRFSSCCQMDTRKELITFSCSLNIASDLQAYDFLIIKRNIYIYIFCFVLFFFLSEVCFSFDKKMVQGLKNGRNDRDLETNNDESGVEVVLAVVTSYFAPDWLRQLIQQHTKQRRLIMEKSCTHPLMWGKKDKSQFFFSTTD